MSDSIRQRACSAVIYQKQILMVKHSHDGKTYWTLPGGQIKAGESPEEAAIREVFEETGLRLDVKRFLFRYHHNQTETACFLLTAPKSPNVKLGFDPEEIHLPSTERMLKDIAWQALSQFKNDIQVSKVIKALDLDY